MTHQVFQLVYSDRFVLIDAGMGPEMFAEMDSGGGSFDEAGFANAQQALGSAAQILITHEHVDHIGGLVEHDAPERLVGRLRLTREQLDNVENVGQLELPPELGSGVEPLDYERLLAVAPGIVLIKAAGHTPGTQMIYVRLADARELLFLGDVAWHMDMIRELHYRPRLVTDFFLGEDRRAVLAQFRTLHDLMQAEPDLELIVSHDREQRRRLIESRIMGAPAGALSGGFAIIAAGHTSACVGPLERGGMRAAERRRANRDPGDRAESLVTDYRAVAFSRLSAPSPSASDCGQAHQTGPEKGQARRFGHTQQVLRRDGARGPCS